MVQPIDAVRTSRPARLAIAAVVVAALVPLIWPGDIPFINDEPQLIASAARANEDRRLAAVGIEGTYGFTYGPAPTWVYQALLAISHNLIVVSVLHAALMSAVTAGALWWLARSLGLWIWFLPVPLLSPYFWFYARVLWDNTFLLPLGALTVAGYAAFLTTRSSIGLRASWAGMLLIPLVHLMGFALVIPIAMHMLLFHSRALWQHKWSLAAMATAVVVAAAPYGEILLAPRPVPPGDGSLEGWWFPLFGGRLLSAGGLDYFFGPALVSGPLFTSAARVSAIAYGLVWAGLLVAVLAIITAVRRRTWSPTTHVAAIALCALVCQSAADGISSRFQHPHYQNGTWIVFVLLAWLAADALVARGGAARRTAGLVTGVLMGALILASGALAIELRRHGGTREVYGPTLANQLQVARALVRYDPDSDVQIRVAMWEHYPHTPAILRELLRHRYIRGPRRDLLVRYASPEEASGVIELVER
jgi:hypothetical protein